MKNFEQERAHLLAAIKTTLKEAYLIHDMERLEMIYQKYTSGYTPTKDELKNDIKFINSFYEA